MLQTGSIVCVKAGRGKQRFFAVVGHLTPHLLLSDGRERPLAHPKKKNPKHLAPTARTLSAAEMQTDRALRKALRLYTADCDTSREE